MAIAGRIEYEITVDSSGLTKGLDDAKKETNKFAESLKNAGSAGAKALGASIVAGATASAVAITKLTGNAISAYADFEQLAGGVETLFAETEGEIKSFEEFYGKSWDELKNSTEGFNTTADEVMANAQNAFKTAGMSANEYMEIVSSFSASLMQSVGNSWEAMEISDMAIQDMADNANKMGSSIESISTAYKGFAKQNYTMLDNLKLGYGGTKGEMERLLADAEKISGVHYDISNLDDVYNAIHVIQTELKITGTTAEEAMNTISGSANMLKSAWQNLMVGIADDGADFDKLINDFMESFNAFAKNLVPRIGIAIKGAVKVIGTLVPELIKELPNLLNQILPAVIEGAIMLVTALVQHMPEILSIFIDNIDVFVQGIVDIIFALIPLLPQILILLVEAIVKTIVSLFASLGNSIGEAFVGIFKNDIKPFFEGVFAFFGDFSEGALKAFDDFGKGIRVGLQNIGQWFHDVFQGIWDFVVSVFSNIGNFFKGVWDKIASIFTGIGTAIGEAVSGAFRAVVNGILSFIEGFINTPVNILNGFIDLINAAFGFIGVNLGKIGTVKLPRMASGGIVPAQKGGQLILAGEGGQDEWVVPESKMADMIQKINEQGGTGSGITINIQGVFATSDAEQRAVAEQIYDKLQEINKSRMGAYL